MDSNDRFQTLKKQATDIVESIPYNKLIELGRTIVNAKEGETLEEIMGDLQPTIDVLRQIEPTFDYEVFRKYEQYTIKDKTVDWEQACKEMKEFIEKVKKHAHINHVMVMIYQQKYDEIKSEALEKATHKDDMIKEIEELAKEHHDMSLVKERHVTHLYNDGEITSQKGGDIYGMRNQHCMYSALIVPPISFPIEDRNGFSYAILTDENANMIRNKMKQLMI